MNKSLDLLGDDAYWAWVNLVLTNLILDGDYCQASKVIWLETWNTN